ncbi:MAG TPA: nuclear transport factor 2 family protein [Bacteroidales bacterium]|nr:nuclear transport factor 2 family protein [Bacteroidales bacterium]
MRKLFILLLFTVVCVALSCSRNSGNEHISQPNLNLEREKVENILEKYMIAIENQDFHTIENIWESGDSAMLLGTDSDERLMGWHSIRNAYRKQFGLLSDTYIAVSDQFIRLNDNGSMAWFSQRMNYSFLYQDKAMTLNGVRFTGILAKNPEGQWKMVQGHLSVPAQINIGK